MAYGKKTGGRKMLIPTDKIASRKSSLSKRKGLNTKLNFEVPNEIADIFLGYVEREGLNRTQALIKILKQLEQSQQ